MLFSYLTSQAEFSIWRSLRSQCIRLSCSNCCLLQSILSCHSSDRMSKLFLPLPSALSICRDLMCCFCFTQGEKLKCSRWRLQATRLQAPVNPFAKIKLRVGLCPAVSLPGSQKRTPFYGYLVVSYVFPSLFFWVANNHKQIMGDNIHDSLDRVSLEIQCAFQH